MFILYSKNIPFATCQPLTKYLVGEALLKTNKKIELVLKIIQV